MQVESKTLTKRFLIFILRLLIKTIIPLISNRSPFPRRLFNLEALEAALLEGSA